MCGLIIINMSCSTVCMYLLVSTWVLFGYSNSYPQSNQQQLNLVTGQLLNVCCHVSDLVTHSGPTLPPAIRLQVFRDMDFLGEGRGGAGSDWELTVELCVTSCLNTNYNMDGKRKKATCQPPLWTWHFAFEREKSASYVKMEVRDILTSNMNKD